MIATLFGDLEWGDQNSLGQWLQGHDLEHRLLIRTWQGLGQFLTGIPLWTIPDNDWMGRHGLSHVAMGRLYPPDSSAPTVTLLQPVWKDKRNYEDWHLRHDFIHQVIRQQLGIYGSS